MHNNITYNQIVERFNENSLNLEVLKLSDKSKILISQYGGRIFGPFFTDWNESLFWVNSSFNNKKDFYEFLKSKQWNLGGERLWIAPEIQFRIKDRDDFWNTIILPEDMDPGKYELRSTPNNNMILSADMKLEAYNISNGIKEIHVERTISNAINPLININEYQDLMENLSFAGYEHTIKIVGKKNHKILAEAWLIIQLNPGGYIYIPVTNTDYTDYFKPIDDRLQKIEKNYFKLKITGDRQYKVGYKSAYNFGRLAYYNIIGNDKAYIIIRNFLNNPSSLYSEEPPDKPGQRGNSIHIYNDDGNAGGFGELECNGQTIGGITEKSFSFDQMTLWVYMGSIKNIKKILEIFLGIKI